MSRLSGRMVTVEFVGHSGGIVTEYDGKKYSFSRKHPIKTIPIEVYDFIRDSDTYLKSEITIVGEQNKPTDFPATGGAEEPQPESKEAIVNPVQLPKPKSKPKAGPKKRATGGKK